MAYVPHKQQYAAFYEDSSGANKQLDVPEKAVDLCMLARWNRELPFTELPNMAIDFLNNDSISGSTILEKTR